MIQTNPIDFSNCPSAFRKFGGSESKDSIMYNGEPYMIKYTTKKVTINDLGTSYPNNVFSEYIGSHIVQSLGITAHDTLLGTYNSIPVVVCKDFRTDDTELQEFTWFMLNMYYRSEIGRIPTYKQLYDVMTNNPRLSVIRDKAIENYWDIFIADALIGNFDRHKDNFGYLVSRITGTIRPAPVYDCGSSLYPHLSTEGMLKVLGNKEAILQRMYEFPKAAINMSDDIKNEIKPNYFDFLNNNTDVNCTNALLRIQPRIDLNKINEIIDSAPYIPSEKKLFYKKMIQFRKELVIDKAYNHIIEQIAIDKDKPSLIGALNKKVVEAGSGETENRSPMRDDPTK